MNQIYQSQIKDLFYKGFEATPQLTINRKIDKYEKLTVVVENTTNVKYTKKKEKELIDAINHGLDNRKMRDTEENETSSRAHLIFSIYLRNRYDGKENCSVKYTFVDLAGLERVAKIEISKKLYLEACFINESLESLQRVARDLTYGGYQKYKDIDFSVNPLTHIVSDTLGHEKGYSQLLVLINPSVIDLQDTLQTLQFAVNTGKVRRRVGLWGEVVGITRAHTILINNNEEQLSIHVSDISCIA